MGISGSRKSPFLIDQASLTQCVITALGKTTQSTAKVLYTYTKKKWLKIQPVTKMDGCFAIYQ